MNFTAYIEGKSDYRRGRELDDNPFIMGSAEWLSWREGWLQVESVE